MAKRKMTDIMPSQYSIIDTETSTKIIKLEIDNSLYFSNLLKKFNTSLSLNIDENSNIMCSNKYCIECIANDTNNNLQYKCNKLKLFDKILIKN